MQVNRTMRLLLISLVSFSLVPIHLSIAVGQARKAQTPDALKGVVIFEIIEKDARPKAAGDEHLFFRLYENGNVEFEDQHQNGASEWAFEMHKLKLNEEERYAFTSLARACLRLPNDFDPLQRLEEKVSITKIRIKDENGYMQVVIHNYSPENEKTKLYYPDAARRLIEKATNKRKNYHQVA